MLFSALPAIPALKPSGWSLAARGLLGFASLLITSCAAGCPSEVTDRWLSGDFWRDAGIDDLHAQFDCGVNIQATATGGNTPLHLATRYSENPAVIQALLDNGADLETKDNFGNTPLLLAVVTQASPPVFEALFDNGANLETNDNFGNTPLLLAIATNANPAIFQALLDEGANIEARDADGRTPLHLAARFTNNVNVNRSSTRPRRGNRGQERARRHAAAFGGGA